MLGFKLSFVTQDTDAKGCVVQSEHRVRDECYFMVKLSLICFLEYNKRSKIYRKRLDKKFKRFLCKLMVIIDYVDEAVFKVWNFLSYTILESI